VLGGQAIDAPVAAALFYCCTGGLAPGISHMTSRRETIVAAVMALVAIASLSVGFFVALAR